MISDKGLGVGGFVMHNYRSERIRPPLASGIPLDFYGKREHGREIMLSFIPKRGGGWE